MLNYIIVGAIVYGIVWLLNKKYFNENPMRRGIAWMYTVLVFFVASIVMSFLISIEFGAISNMTGEEIHPKNIFNFKGGVIMAFTFFTSIKKKKKGVFEIVTKSGNMVAEFDSKEKAEEYLAKNENSGYVLKEL